MKTITEILALGPVMPVVVIDDARKAVPLAQALLAGGIRTMEITLRTPCALDAIEAVASGCGDIIVGAGTVITAKDARAAVRRRGHLCRVARHIASAGGGVQSGRDTASWRGGDA